MRHADLFKEFIEKSKMNYLTTLDAKGLLSEDNERFVGVWNGMSSSKNSLDSVKHSDLIILLGVTITDVEIMGISLDDFRKMKKPMIFASRNTFKVDEYNASPVTLRDLLYQLIRRIDSKEMPIREPQRFDMVEEKLTFKGVDEITYDSSIHQISRCPMIVKDSILVVDVTLALFGLSLIKVQKDQFTSQCTWGTKGYSLGAGLGAYFATSKRPIIFIGDGGFQQTPQTLSSLVKHKSNAIIFLFNNGSLSIEQWTMNPKVFKEPKDPFDRFNLVLKWDYIRYAQSVGAKGFLVKNHQDLENALKEIENFNGVALVDLTIPTKDIPMLTRWRVDKKDE